MSEIIAIPSLGEGGLNEFFDSKFGRCESFTFVTIENGKITKVHCILNSAADAMGGAGIKSAQIVGNHGANTTIIGFLGPNAAQALSALDLKLFKAPDQKMKIKDLVKMYLAGELNKLNGANVGSHFGMGRGRRGGSGGGMASGGRGRRRGQGPK